VIRLGNPEAAEIGHHLDPRARCIVAWTRPCRTSINRRQFPLDFTLAQLLVDFGLEILSLVKILVVIGLLFGG
jgi:hypothetical protein